MQSLPAPTDVELGRRYEEIGASLARAGNAAGWRDAFAAWDGERRTWRTHANATHLRYTLDTRDEAAREAVQTLDRRSPGVTALDDAVKRRFLESPVRPQLEADLGPQAFALWDADVAAFDDAVKADLVRESELARGYTELLGTATVEFDGEQRSLGGLGAFLQDPDRETRHRAETARWSAYEARGERLDAIFDELVRLRDGIAKKLGYADYVALGYKRMHRIDYSPADVARYRDQVAAHVVPLADKLVRRHAAAAGYDRAYLWDESTLGVHTRIAPRGDAAWLLARTREALAGIDPALGEFVEVLFDRGLLDLENRPGKALGAYCTQFPSRKEPFVFANFNGSRSDVKTLMHELGHAFQGWRSRDKAVSDYLVPTYESAEIHSMSLEYLAWPQMEKYFGDDADAYRREHLLDALLFLPYGVAVDHFQHLVYSQPTATPAERHAMWREMEARYLPWRAYGDLGFPAAGRLWQEKRHIYVAPFYYIDYTLALCCALQFWVRADRDRDEAMAAYVTLCGRGGEAPFRELVRSAGLRSPFDDGALADVVARVEAAF